MSTVLIVGGGGFIGNHLKERLVYFETPKRKVVLFDNFSVFPHRRPKSRDLGDIINVDSGMKLPLRVLTGDVRSKADIKKALAVSCEDLDGDLTIFYLAARRGYDNDWSAFGTTNVAGSYVFFDALQEYKDKVSKIILSSSQAIFPPGMDLDEKTAVANAFGPPSIYGITKLQQEDIFRFMSVDGPRIIALRYCVVLGSGQSMLNGETGVLRNWYRSWKRNESPEIYGDGGQIRDFVHIDDVIDANICAMKSWNGNPPCGFAPFNISGPAVSLNHLAEVFQQVTHCKDPVHVTSKQPAGDKSITSSAKSAQNGLGWEAKLGIEMMIRDFIGDMNQREQMHSGY